MSDPTANDSWSEDGSAILTRYRWMTFCPEWLTGSPNLDTSNALYLWVYLVVSVLATYVIVSALLTSHVPSVTAAHEHDVGISFHSERLCF